MLLFIGAKPPLETDYLIFQNRQQLNDTIYLKKGERTIIVISSEPSCTGCKVNLNEYLNKQQLKFYLLLNDGNLTPYSLLMREKSAKKYFPSTETVLYTPDSGYVYQFNTSRGKYAFIANQSPSLLLISKSNRKIAFKHLDYEMLFDDVFVNEKYLDRNLNIKPSD